MWLVNLTGLVLIGLIVWWFWLYRPREVRSSGGRLRIVVGEGTYQPARVELPAAAPAILEFLRQDPSPCAEVVVFPALGLSAELPLDRVVSVRLPPLTPGRYVFHCQMQMYRGEVHVV